MPNQASKNRHQLLNFISLKIATTNCCVSVTVSKDQAGSTDRVRPIPSKFSALFSPPDKITTGGIFSKIK